MFQNTPNIVFSEALVGKSLTIV